MRLTIPSITVLGTRVAMVDERAALHEIAQLFDGHAPAVIAYANAHTLNLARRNAQFRDALNAAALVFNDGAGLAFAARLQGRRFPANLNGTDFTPAILRGAAARDASVFLFGAAPGVAEAAATRLMTSIPGLRIVGTEDGFRDDISATVARVRGSGADVLLVALGNPAQELWLDAHLGATGAHIGIAVGGFLDFTAGTVKRAPRWVRRIRLEWLFRVGQEPRRLLLRYLIGNPSFLIRIVAERLRRRPPRGAGPDSGPG